ncbi:polyketide synthase [Hymenobacter caeli]|uniref:Amino acid adenylation domain-containing protein n=1 Tax=Hymenobacter caeli TaxID=2735894 RepID=A0ABX2FR76_9BACT|nr:polyketide synthase [Hymenobacter caeli]NRT19688.1 amino acid adenylation domain-containing protein [Hymenobacter caeli]
MDAVFLGGFVANEAQGPKLVHRLVEQAAATYADRRAVVFGEESLTYRQLNERADRLGQALLHHAPAAEFVGISAARGLEMVVGMLAILKAGKAYLPLDPTYPAERLRRIVAGSGLTACVAPAAATDFFAGLGLAVVASDADYAFAGQAVPSYNATVCVLYTSGSTGQPKGVCMTQTGLVQLMDWQVAHNQAQPGLNTLQFCHLTFDVSFLEVFLPLVSGGTVHLIDNTHRLDAGQLLAYLRRADIHRAYLPYVALQYLAEAATAENLFPEALREVIIGGEQLKITPQIRGLFAALPACTLMHVYGPAEGSIWVTEHKLPGRPADWPDLPNMGWPVVDAELLILDEDLRLQPAGSGGEVCIAGNAVAAGYLNQPALTAERFLTWPHPQKGPTRIYRTGDMARYLPDGSLEFLGRRDDQVKIRGNRVEIGEIEVALNRIGALRESVVVMRPGPDEQKQVVAYLVSATGQPDDAAIRQELARTLPDYMLPAALVWLDALPRTVSDKVDKKLLPAPALLRPASAGPYRRPAPGLEHSVADLWRGWLQLDRVGADDNFFELGGNSLLAQKTVAALKQLGHALPITKLYQFPTAAGVARYLAPAAGARPAAAPLAAGPAPAAPGHADVAIIGMAGRFPGANTLAELWDVLREGRETTRFFTLEELDPAVPAHVKNDPLYVPARGILDHADRFDAAFFGLNPRLASVMDPQQRIFLEIAWEALEQTGYLPQQRPDATVGVYAGSGNNTYYLRNVLPRADVLAQVGDFQAMAVNEKDFVALRTAYQLNLKGPAVSVHSACSTSLLAVAQAVEAIRQGHCDVALAGGVSVTAPLHSGHLYQEGAMLSRDGHCRPFDADSHGTVFSDGAGVVLLKSLAAAQRDGDLIHAVIKGVGVNNDGGGKGSFTAPSAEGQAGAIGRALADGRIDPATVSYVEAHGTGTPLGDPIEMEGLALAFGEQPAGQFCAVGSIKSNMGHLTAAAGVAGLLKTVLALRHRQLPASLGYATPNPHIDFAHSPFFVNAALADWPAGPGPRRAGVSSFGVGGTNVHVVVEEFIAPTAAPAPGPARPAELLVWSAQSDASREAYGQRLADALGRPDAPALADAAATLATTRPAFGHRRFAVVADAPELVAQLRAGAAPGTAATLAEAPGDVVFLFPGQGAQYLGMGRELYAHEPVYRTAVEECADLLAPHLPVDIREVLYAAADDDPAAESRLRDTRYAQPALFVTEYALARLWLSWGLAPTAFCGHSVGEFVAAQLAGVFSLADALALVANRGRLVAELPRGSMLSVRLAASQLALRLPAGLSLAAVNGPSACVVAGPDEEIAAFAQALDAQDVPNRVLATSHAFHSAMMDPVVDEFEQVVASVTLHRPQKPVVSTVSGTWLTDAQATDPRYWAAHLRQTVRFAAALDTLLAEHGPVLLEVGPGQVLTALAQQQLAGRPGTALASLKKISGTDQPEYRALLAALGQLWLRGTEPNWAAVYAGRGQRLAQLPTYAFDRKPCWLEPAAAAPVLAAPALAAPPTPTAISFLPLPNPMRKSALLTVVNELLENASGVEMSGVTPDMSFLEMGLDSLSLTQLAITLKKQFNLPITFRQLSERYATPNQLTDYLDQALPPEAYRPGTTAPLAAPAPGATPLAAAPLAVPTGNDSALGLIAQQLQLLARQVALLHGPGSEALGAPAAPAPAPVAAGPGPVAPPAAAPLLTPEEVIEIKKPFGASPRIEKQASQLTATQQAFLQQLTARYTEKTKASKAFTQRHRPHMADPRVVSGFRPLTKELVYPLVVERSKGSRLWDLDGNEYIDILNGFGSCLFGHQPDFVAEALHAQIERGFEVGPQHPLAGEVSELLCELTGFERVGLCNTGSEAVLGAMRIARTATGRSLVVAFTGSYHGIIDEALVRGTKALRSFPAAAGILPEAVQNMLILDYGTDESLRILAERAHELAAVLVEPVQSRRPEFQPVAFLQQVRALTAAAGTVLIFDEVITGFRMHLGGAQALFGIRADLATYGKVIGGGLSIGVIAGRRDLMDALDGGAWQYGDASVPEVGVTYFAGTFVRHPLALAAAKASLLHLKAASPALQTGLTAKADRLAGALNASFAQQQLPFFVAQFGSLWKIKFREEVPYAELLFTWLREKGLHIWDGFPCFMTEAHTEAEVTRVIDLMLEGVREMVAAGFFKAGALAPPAAGAAPAAAPGLNQPPVPGARLGRDRNGNPAWFIADPDHAGDYLKIEVQG